MTTILRNESLRRALASIAILALTLVACGPAGENDGENLESTQQELYGSVSQCFLNVRNFNKNSTHVTSIEGTDPRRASCNAWVTRFMSTSPATEMVGREADVYSIPADPLPTNAQDCGLVWKSDQIWVTRGDGNWWRALDGDMAAAWVQVRPPLSFQFVWACSMLLSFVSPPPPDGTPPTKGALVLEKASSAHPSYKWLSTYPYFDVITQPWYAFWALRAETSVNFR